MSERFHNLVAKYVGKIFQFSKGTTKIKITRIANRKNGHQYVWGRILEVSANSRLKMGDYIKINIKSFKNEPIITNRC